MTLRVSLVLLLVASLRPFIPEMLAYVENHG